ncbi:hypothetical protein Cni_G27389 [Canna indica]|uniref:Urease accessory protein UreH-like transmembrane domain-containing protein n=1 Tax=Canna indica TaxID=4628 RepID=A0AAQ3L3R3_9LILI|nr:hypothetical protein Cni_G27389 [Canna indica]
MERLLSSRSAPLNLARTLPLLHRGLPSNLRSAPCLIRHRGLKPPTSLFSKQDGSSAFVPPGLPSPVRCPADSRSQKEARQAQLPAAFFVEAGGLDALSLRKVAYSTVIFALSAIILTMINPILAQPSFATASPATISGGQLIRSELLTSAWTGFFAGCLHTLSGPDHLAALAPLSIGRTRTDSAIVGALWGCGHEAGQVIFGLLFLMLKDHLHIEILHKWGTIVVGLTLLAIGALGIREASQVPASCAALDECQYLAKPSDLSSGMKKEIGFTTFATGIVHGLQPDALMPILPALALPSHLASAAFLCMFLIGTVFAMASYTVFIGSCAEALKQKAPRVREKLTWAASLVAASLGLVILITQYFGFSLY